MNRCQHCYQPNPNAVCKECQEILDHAPEGAIICDRCYGYGLVTAFVPGPMQTAEDCDQCNCEGWVIEANCVNCADSPVGEDGLCSDCRVGLAEGIF